MTQLRTIPIDLINPSPHQPRRGMDLSRLSELTQSIQLHGVLQPIRVRPLGSRFELIVGERRWTAARNAGLELIPALVVSADDQRSMVEGLIENIQREGLNFLDRAEALERLRASLGLRSWEEVGRYVGISRVHVHRLLNATRLPAAIQQEVRVRGLSEKHCRAYVRLRSQPQIQMRFWQRVVDERLSGEAAMALSDAMLPAPAKRGSAKARRKPGSSLKTLTDELLTQLVVASKQDLNVVRAELNDLRGWLAEVLDGRPARAGRARRSYSATRARSTSARKQR
jgi:ParB family chromosome partitioning protein